MSAKDNHNSKHGESSRHERSDKNKHHKGLRNTHRPLDYPSPTKLGTKIGDKNNIGAFVNPYNFPTNMKLFKSDVNTRRISEKILRLVEQTCDAYLKEAEACNAEHGPATYNARTLKRFVADALKNEMTSDQAKKSNRIGFSQNSRFWTSRRRTRHKGRTRWSRCKATMHRAFMVRSMVGEDSKAMEIQAMAIKAMDIRAPALRPLSGMKWNHQTRTEVIAINYLNVE